MRFDPLRAVHHAAVAATYGESPLVLAVSGGLDSTVLLHAMNRVASRRIAGIATFDHGTGVAATEALAHVQALADRAGLPCFTGTLSGALEAPDGLEAAWRKARHAFLRGHARRLSATIVTGHTEDDHLETILMRIMRGSGARGLAALHASTDIRRPFVGLRRETMRAYATRVGLTWIEDPGNRSPDFLRNRVRHDLLPALRTVQPDIDDALLDLARRAADVRNDLDCLVQALVRPDETRHDRVVVAMDDLREFDRDSLALLWGALAARAGSIVDRRSIARAVQFIASGRRTGLVTLATGWCLRAEYGVYILERSVERAEHAEISLPQAGSVTWGRFRFHAASAPTPNSVPSAASNSVWYAAFSEVEPKLVVRGWSDGDRLAPSASQPRRRVRRYLSDAGVRGRDRLDWPVVTSGSEVVWIPGVRRSDAATDRSGGPVRHYICERIDG